MTTLTNLADLDTTKACEAVFDLELLHPTSKAPLGLFIQIIGVQSQAMTSLRNRMGNELLRQNFEAQRKGKAEAPTVESTIKRSVDTLTEATVGWYAIEPAEVDAKGKPKGEAKRIPGLPFGDTVLEFTKAAASDLYTKPAFEWLRDQVDAGVGDLGNFLKG